MGGEEENCAGYLSANSMAGIWQEHSFRGVQLQGAPLPAKADVVVVGAGIVGLFTALHYKRAHGSHRVVVLERGNGPDGASVRNAGFACFGSPSELLADVAKEGEATAMARVEERWRGLLELRRELGDERIGFEPTGGHELFSEADPLYTKVAEGFDRLNGSLHSIFGQRVYEWRDGRKSDLGLNTGHLAFTALEGPIHTGRMMRTLLAKTLEAGVDVVFGSEVQNIAEDRNGAVLGMKDGSQLSCAIVVVATNGYACDLIPDVDVVPARGQVLLTAPIAGLHLRGTFHANEGFYYFRDFEGGVLLGGGRHLDVVGESTTEDATTPLIQADLERMLSDVILPNTAFTISHRWSGIMGFRKKGKTPLVDFVSPRVVAAVGLSGMGVAIGIRVARKAADLLR